MVVREVVEGVEGRKTSHLAFPRHTARHGPNSTSRHHLVSTLDLFDSTLPRINPSSSCYARREACEIERGGFRDATVRAPGCRVERRAAGRDACRGLLTLPSIIIHDSQLTTRESRRHS